MTNREIAKVFSRLGKIMELHGENAFKVRSYTNAYMTIRKLEKPLAESSPEELAEIRGVGKAISDKIQELLTTGSLATYQKYADITPPGIVQMLDVKGLGPKKIRTIWDELHIESVGELLYACNENRLVELKGFGLKTQQTLRTQLEYFMASQGKYHYATVADHASHMVSLIEEYFPDDNTSLCGAVRRLMPELSAIEVLTTASASDIIDTIPHIQEVDGEYQFAGFPFDIYEVDPESFGTELFELSASDTFLEQLQSDVPVAATEAEVFDELGLAYCPPEYRESQTAYEQCQSHEVPTLIADADLRGVIHNHSTYSDGIHTLAEMAAHTKESGYEYLVMSDHSKAAFYADGLSEDKVVQQMAEIDQLNAQLAPFRIYKSIECDILSDGSLDYSDDFLQEFDLVIASVHSNLRMDEPKANARLIKAIEHPSTHILGHPTGRLLLSRVGYPIDHKLIIDACVANGVVIELNANPQRLDIDWTWIPYVLEKGGMISINPDAHNRAHIHYMKYGVAAARKGGLTTDRCLNAKSLSEFQSWVAALS